MSKAVVTAYQCSFCDTAIYARHESDKRSCECGNLDMQGDSVFIHDFSGYTRIEDLTLRQSQEILEADFNSTKDNFGILRHAKHTVARLQENISTNLGSRVRMTDTGFVGEV